ncbi:uncharacterized protein LOC113339444 [Papaver somniferum]|uniref:uncharacterized protein LOC113339444 n=1 Tax=Papaver somniferum TaxID=3469 RepID=UPI000E6F6A80|nr:uncharacterized protein LOC113339444 [Papaver somniferum]
MYTVACFYTSKEIIYKKVIGVLRKCWEGLIFTVFWGFFMGAIYTPAALVLLLRFFKGVEDLKVYSDPYFTGFFYMLGVWSVAIVVMELEKDYGIKALAKSVRLIFSKIWTSCAAYGSLEITFTGIILPSCYPVVYGNKMNLVGKLFVVIGCNLLTIIWIYFSLVRFTVVYLVCKSYHNEDISTATTHATVVPTVPLVSEKEVQLERVPV